MNTQVPGTTSSHYSMKAAIEASRGSEESIQQYKEQKNDRPLTKSTG
jgi:hypothetical protein